MLDVVPVDGRDDVYRVDFGERWHGTYGVDALSRTPVSNAQPPCYVQPPSPINEWIGRSCAGEYV